MTEHAQHQLPAGGTELPPEPRPLHLTLLDGDGRADLPAPATDAREERLFRSLDVDNESKIRLSELTRRLASVGLRADDIRLRDSMNAFHACTRAAAKENEAPSETKIPPEDFFRAIRHNIRLIERALQGDMIIPEFVEFCDSIEGIYRATRENRSGSAADYIPQLNLGDSAVDRYGVAFCTIDGQRHSFGDADTFFSVQSMSKPITYCLALEEHGPDVVHGFVGHEPSGASFNELTLDKQNRPHNPMINAGAIMSSAFVKLSDKRRLMTPDAAGNTDTRGWAGERFDYVLGQWQKLCGGEKPRFSTSVYLSERETADRNFALSYFMREKGAFPEDADFHDVLDFYFQCCAIELNAEMMSVLAATLANGGICPTSGERVFKTETVQKCLSLMSACGMYDYSGEFAFTIGLPSKSGVSGGIMIVIPNVMGFCTWSPRLDAHGNSVRGLEFCRELVNRFNFHNFDILTSATDKQDPRIGRARRQSIRVNELIWAASKGDLGAMQDQVLHGASLDCADYDMRSPLHLAAAENQVAVLNFLVEQSRPGNRPFDLNPRDRWGGTPLDDAYRHGNRAAIDILENAGCTAGSADMQAVTCVAAVPPLQDRAESDKAAEMIWAASAGDLTTIYRLVAQGVPLDIADYDLRTPLHLAAAEGHQPVVEYFVAQSANLNPQDRWDNTPFDDAKRHGHDNVGALLGAAGGIPGFVLNL